MLSPPSSVPTEEAFPVLRHPAKDDALPVLVTIPHFGVDALPEFGPEAYADAEFAHFAHGFADPFAASIYGDLHHTGATVLASPYSRLFVDLNRARDDFQANDESVESNRGVVRTHTLSGRAVFREPLSTAATEQRLQQYYDPYHETLQGLVANMTADAGRMLLLDAHTALAKRFGDREIIISTQRGRTATAGLDQLLGQHFVAAGFRVDYDVSGYAGGHTVRSYGQTDNSLVEAIQVEVGLTTLLDMPRMEFINAIKSGERPAPCPDRLGQLRSCLAQAIAPLAQALGG